MKNQQKVNEKKRKNFKVGVRAMMRSLCVMLMVAAQLTPESPFTHFKISTATLSVIYVMMAFLPSCFLLLAVPTRF